MTAPYGDLPGITLYFWKCGQVVPLVVKGETPRDLCKKYRQVPCMRQLINGQWEFGKYTYLGWKRTKGAPKQLKALQLILSN